MKLFTHTYRWMAALGLISVLLSGCATQTDSETSDASGQQSAKRFSLLSPKHSSTSRSDVKATVDTQATVDARALVSNDILFSAMQLTGSKYRFGGSSPETGFDCSGLIQYVYNKSIGLTLPRTVREMNQMSAPSIAKSELEPGDLVIFKAQKRYPDHAGIYVGEGRFLHAPSSGGRVRIDSLSTPYWQRSYLGAKRVVTDERASLVLARND